ncbi:MAG: hypothetical protein ACKOGA_04190, partial [Planctomycetaceae bacterium]
ATLRTVKLQAHRHDARGVDSKLRDGGEDANSGGDVPWPLVASHGEQLRPKRPAAEVLAPRGVFGPLFLDAGRANS